MSNKLFIVILANTVIWAIMLIAVLYDDKDRTTARSAWYSALVSVIAMVALNIWGITLVV